MPAKFSEPMVWREQSSEIFNLEFFKSGKKKNKGMRPKDRQNILTTHSLEETHYLFIEYIVPRGLSYHVMGGHRWKGQGKTPEQNYQALCLSIWEEMGQWTRKTKNSQMPAETTLCVVSSQFKCQTVGTDGAE